ncbi:gluconate 2-dehydrogenase subunit 3 family protein [Streptomyces decoyicus]|uniref:gluconate 2-dehydrogenase subunit 3 family protein n=1 Tax=Streptomyces decoyicus TaxID=249567 RepID=UPI0036440F1B
MDEGYGTDPNLVTPDAPWPGGLNDQQKKLVAVLGDIILPGTDEYPAPSAVGIVKFFDEWLGAPYRTQQKDKVTITTGLAMVDQASQQQFGLDFVDLDGSQQRVVVDQIASTTAADRSFFVRFRSLLLNGYYTTDIGFKAIGYIGNVPLHEFPGVPPETQRIIDDELRKLGL